MNIGMKVINAEKVTASQSSPKKLNVLEEKRKNMPETPKENTNGDKKANTGNLKRINKSNQLPILEKRGGSRARVVTPPPNTNEIDENTTQMSTYSRATKKVPLQEYGNQKNSRLPGKSLPRLVGGLRKLEKMPLGKGFEPLDETKMIKAKGITKPGKELSEKGPLSTVFLKQFSKTIAGYSDGKTKTNQDSIYVNCNVKGSSNCALFGVFDGHGTMGHKVSQFLKANVTGMVS